MRRDLLFPPPGRGRSDGAAVRVGVTLFGTSLDPLPMTEWWTYRPEDFLLFSARTYWRLFELHNAALWPVPLAGPLLGALLLWLLWRRWPGAPRWTCAILAILWASVGWSFVLHRYAEINWAAAWLAPLFAIEVLLLLGAALVRGPAKPARGFPAAAIGALLVGLALAYPLLAPLGGRPWGAAEIFGIAPDPTAIGTLGFVLFAGLRRAWLLPIPLVWCLVGGATLLTMGAWEGWLPLGAAAAAALCIALPQRTRRAS